MNKLAGGLFALSVVTGAALSERLLDPFDRHDREYELEGPSGKSEVFYVSSNWHDEQGRHDDRVGDLLLVTSVASGAGALCLRLELDKKVTV